MFYPAPNPKVVSSNLPQQPILGSIGRAQALGLFLLSEPPDSAASLDFKGTVLPCLLRLGCFSVLSFYLPEPELVPAVGAAAGVGDSAGPLISMAQRGNA